MVRNGGLPYRCSSMPPKIADPCCLRAWELSGPWKRMPKGRASRDVAEAPEGFPGRIVRNSRASATRSRSARHSPASRSQFVDWPKSAGSAAAERLQISYATCLIRKSSIRLPDFNFAASQRGVLPRPAHVSDGRSGFRNFGTTVGYGRRPVGELSRSASTPPLSCFRRFSSTRFSASSEAASMDAISSCSAHNSSVDIDLNSLRFTTVPNHDFDAAVIVGRKHEQNKAD